MHCQKNGKEITEEHKTSNYKKETYQSSIFEYKIKNNFSKILFAF